MRKNIDTSARWFVRLVVAAVPVLVVAGVAGASIVSDREEERADTVVTASAGDGVTFAPLSDLPPIPPSPPVIEVPTTTPAPTTTAAAAPTTTTTRPRPSTTVTSEPPATTATSAPAGSPTSVPRSTPSTTVAAGPATVALANQSDLAVDLKVNGQPFRLDPGQQIHGVTVMPAPSGNDTIELRVVIKPTCGEGDADNYFKAGQAYRLTVVNGPDGACGSDLPHSVRFQVRPA